MDLDFESWLLVGQEKGWVSETFCNTHDGGPITDEEADEWDAGGDPCNFHVRVWEYN